MKEFDATLLKSLDEFMEYYKTTDTKHIYSNGTEFVPIFRIKQWLEYNNRADLQTRWNSLREWLKKQMLIILRYEIGSYKEVLDKMNELEGENE